MITSIQLPLRAPFGCKQATIDGLDRVCFFFGPNGSGKTTISQLIADEANNQSSSHIHWASNDSMQTYVYNRRFIEANFANKASVPGVFTMGAGMVDAQKRIDELTEVIEKDRGKKNDAQENLDQAKSDLETIEAGILEACWAAKGAIPEALQKHMAGYNTKARFHSGLIPHLAAVGEDDVLPEMTEIEERAAVVFDDSTIVANQLPEIDFRALIRCENASIFQKAIIGKENIPIGALITRLEISDWVEKGRGYVEGDVCPFCQQHTVTEKLKADLEGFFDETYQMEKDELRRASQEYEMVARNITVMLKDILVTHSDFIDASELESRIVEFNGIVTSNKTLLHQKQAEPSCSIELASAQGVCEALATLLERAANAISKHNNMIKNRADQKDKIIADLWKYAAITALPAVASLQENEKRIKNRIKGLTDSIGTLDTRIEQNSSERRQVEATLTNVSETADAINILLAKFGFTGFNIVVAEDNKSYRIERIDGTLVEDTLSEGEASFLAFLYFYHLMNGSSDATGTTDRRVVVIDDPITSMDADVLFIASSLVRQLAKDARDGSGKTEQLIVLTHNITFHREITYIRAGEGNSKTAYYLIRKNGSQSAIEACKENPVNGTYELLWKDFCRDDCSPLTAQNIARRITETFFKLVGVPDIDDLLSDLGSPDREIARSYTAWANAGSHGPFDDETYHNSHENVEVYRRVLQAVFNAAGYGGHYDEMISRYSVISS